MKTARPPAFRLSSRASRLRPSAIREILKATESPDVISFAGGLPAPELFPVEQVRQAADEVLSSEGAKALQYSVTEGFGPLRAWLGEHLEVSAGLKAAPERVLITSGSQQGLDLVSRVLLDPGDVVLVENPGYLGALRCFAANGAELVGVDADEQGIRPDLLARALARSPRPKFLYLVPNFQNPTGATLPAGRRAEVARLAADHGVPVVEDDPYGRLRYEGEALPALCSLPEAGDWIHLGTASKLLAPGLRVAWMAVSDPRLMERLVSAKQSMDLHTSTFAQRLVWELVRRPGALWAHVERLRAAYGRRRDAMLSALERRVPQCAWTRPEGGMFLWLELPDNADAGRLLAAAMRRKVAFVPGEPFWVGEPRRNTLRLNFSNCGEAAIEEGVGRLAAALRDPF